MTIEEIIAALAAIVDGAENRDLNDDEAERYTALEAELAEKRAAIEAEQAAAQRSVEIRARQVAYTTPATPTVTPARTTVSDPDAVLERAFEAYLRTGQSNQDIVELRAQSEGSSAGGGYLVPPGFRMLLVERLKAYGGLAMQAQEIQTDSGQSLEWPTVDDTSNVGEIVAEGGTFAAGADITFGTKTLGAYRYAAGGASNLPLKVSYELLQDSAFDVQAYLARAMGTRLGRIQATHWVTGTGTSQPQGITTPTTVFTTIASTTTPVYAELVKTVHALDPLYRMNAKWLMNDATLSLIRQMVDSNARPLWLPQEMSGMAEPMPGGTLLGYPVVIDQAMPSIAASGSTKFLLFGDLAETYVVRRVKDIQMVVLNELYAANGQVGFMAWARADGTVQNANSSVILGSHS